jgi:hypothetical protein
MLTQYRLVLYKVPLSVICLSRKSTFLNVFLFTELHQFPFVSLYYSNRIHRCNMIVPRCIAVQYTEATQAILLPFIFRLTVSCISLPHLSLVIIWFSKNFFFNGSTAPFRVPRPPHFDASRSHSLDTPHSVGLLWTRDQLVAETST